MGARGGGGGGAGSGKGWSAPSGSASRNNAVKKLQNAETGVQVAYAQNRPAAEKKAAKAALAEQLKVVPDHILKMGGQSLVTRLQGKNNAAWKSGLKAQLSVYTAEAKKRFK